MPNLFKDLQMVLRTRFFMVIELTTNPVDLVLKSGHIDLSGKLHHVVLVAKPLRSSLVAISARIAVMSSLVAKLLAHRVEVVLVG